MPLNFNVTPYYDDFDPKNHYYRILFRPAVAVQTRELTQTQSILQNQITFFADAVYKHGAMVKPGQIAFDVKSNYVRLQPSLTVNGITVPVNMDLMLNQTLKGSITGLSALVVHYEPATVNNDPPTLYVKYLDGGTSGTATQFVESETLTLANNSASTMCVTASANACGLGASVQIGRGVYYIYGYFVQVESQFLVLNKYANTVSTRVGLQIVENIVTPQDDANLSDNASGSTNYGAPGAHRYRIDLVLASKPYDDTSTDQNFVELLRLKDSVRQAIINKTEYSRIADELAARTMDTNGDFTIRPFAIDVREHLDTSFMTKGSVVTASTLSQISYITLAQSAAAIDDYYIGMTLYINDGPGAGQSMTITSYDGATKEATVDSIWAVNKTPTSKSSYLITDPTKVNRGIYPPVPFGVGDGNKLAVGLESGRAYVDGYQIDTLATTYVTVDKARDTDLTTSASVSAPIGTFIYAKNLSNMPMPAANSVAPDFLTIALSNKKASVSFNATNDQVGTARVHAVEFFRGSAQGATDAIYTLYLFDIKLNAGIDINQVRSFYLTSVGGSNDNGNSLNSYGDVVTVFTVSNVNGTGLVTGATLTGPSSVGTETVVYWDSINNLVYTEPAGSPGASNPPIQILTKGTASVSGGTTATITSRSQLFGTQYGTLVYPLPQKVVSTVRGISNNANTSYYTRRIIQATRTSGGQYVFTVGTNETFAPFSTGDYLACVVASTNSSTIGKFINLANYITPSSFSGSPANTTLTFTVASGTGSASGDVIKLMATVIKTKVIEKTKSLVPASASFATPAATMRLGKADIYKLVKVVDSGNTSVAADENNPAHLDITNRYTLDNGQRDYYYDEGRVSLLAGAPSPVGQLKILFKYFNHSGAGDYFSVDSYKNQVDYTAIPSYFASDGSLYNLRDCLDFRPRKSDSNINFSAAGSAYNEPLRPNNQIITDFQYYLSRADKIYLDGQGNFSVIKGTPALVPLLPNDPKDGMLLYTLSLNAYTLSTSDVTYTMAKNAGYKMSDIAKLEQRIENLEYYTSLNLLEQDTSNLSITDTATGLDRFKAGFLVDNFKGFSVANVFETDFKCSMDTTVGTLRPPFIQTATDIKMDPTTSSGYVKRGTCVLLPYTEKVLAQQVYATEIERVNPFAIFTWHGDVTLIPATDTWKNTEQRPDVLKTDSSAFDNYKYTNSPQGTVWNDWQTTWVGVPTVSVQNISPTRAGTAPGATFGTEVNGSRTGPILYQDANGIHPWQNGNTWDQALGVSAQIKETQLVTSSQKITQTRTGITTSVVPQLVKTNVNNVTLSISYYPFIRSRRVNIIGKHFKPVTRVYPFFDGVNVSAYCQPYSDPTLTPSLRQTPWTSQTITWGGNISTGTNDNNGSVTQTVVDPGSTGTFYTGSLGDAIYTDGLGSTTLFFNIPSTDSVKFRTGTRSFVLTSDANNGDSPETNGSANYTAAGVLETDQKTITSVIGPKVVQTAVTQTNTYTQNYQWVQNTIINGWCDPLAESFLVDSEGGAFITKVDVFFATIDNKVPVTLQIRTMVNGYPGPEILPFADKTLYPSNPGLSAFNNSYDLNGFPDTTTNATTGVVTSADASAPTSFVFDTPVYVQDKQEYCFVLLANSVAYTAYIGRMGNKVIGSTSTVSQQPYSGVLFLSQNGTTWTADQTADLKFTIWRASFNPNATATCDMKNVDTDYAILGALPFQTLAGSSTVRVYHENHGMAKGTNSDSWVTLSNVAPGTYNGITNAMLTGTFQINNVDLHSYTITVGGIATGSSRVGPDSVIATQDRQYDSMTAVISNMVVQNTAINASMKTTSGKSVHNNPNATQEPFVIDPVFTPLTLATSTDFVTPRILCSSVDESKNLSGAKSLTIRCVLSTQKENLTPMIDISRMSVITANSLIDDPTYANYSLGMDQGVSITSSSGSPVAFASQTVLTLSGVTGTTFATGDSVTGAASGASAGVVSWDSSRLTVTGVTGSIQFKIGEALTGPNAVGTIAAIQKINTITNTSGALDFSVFTPGRALTITGSGAGANGRTTTTPVTIISINGNVLSVDCGTTDFAAASNVANVILTQYNRYVSEVAPTGCSSAARYITRAFTLAHPANAVKIYFTINRPLGSFVDCYFRILAPNSNAVLNNAIWIPATLDATVDSGVSADPAEFKEYTYTANNIGAYTIIQVKLVMRGGNSSQVPVLKNFRAVCLAT
jgi:hypothetical protein